jgi:hypothetical protein
MLRCKAVHAQGIEDCEVASVLSCGKFFLLIGMVFNCPLADYIHYSLDQLCWGGIDGLARFSP